MSAGNKVLKDIATNLEHVLNKCGVMYHVFHRTKSVMSIKINLKEKPMNIARKIRRCRIY